MDVIINQVWFDPDRVNSVTIQLTKVIPYIYCGTITRTIRQGRIFSNTKNVDALMLCYGTNYNGSTHENN